MGYFDQLIYDKKLDVGFASRWIANPRLFILLTLAIVGVGVNAFSTIGRRLNPEINIPIVIVSKTMPGASATDTESLLTVPLEDKLSGAKNLSQMTSTSGENFTAIALEFTSGTEVNEARDEVRRLVDEVNSFPAEALETKVEALDFERQPIWNLTIASKNKDPISLRILAKELQKELGDQNKLDKAELFGESEEVVEVEIDRKKVQEMGISPFAISSLLSKSSSSYPAGLVYSNKYSFSLNLDKQLKTVADIRNIKVKVGGDVLKLGDLAKVQIANEKEGSDLYFSNMTESKLPAVQILIYKKTGGNIIEAYTQAKKVINNKLKNRSEFIVHTNASTAEEIDKQFDDLTKEFATAIALVVVILFAFLGLRQALVASMTIPLTFLMGFFIMKSLGMTLNFLTMFAFLIALGLLIDDTIVVVSSMTRYFETGKFSAREVGILVWRDFIVPIWSTTILTMWAFLPLLLSTGIIGEFIKPIPVVVSSVLFSSTSIAVLITLPLMVFALEPRIPVRLVKFLKVILFPVYLPIYLLKTGLDSRKIKIRETKFTKIVNKGFVDTTRLSIGYMKLIKTILENRYYRRNTILFLIFFAIMSFVLVGSGVVKTEFFPKTDENILFINASLPQGASSKQTKENLQDLEKYFSEIKEIETITIGSGVAVGEQLDYNKQTSTLAFTLGLVEKSKRNIASYELATKIRKDLKTRFTQGDVEVIEQSGGPPAGADLNIKVSGDDLAVVDRYASKLLDFMKTDISVDSASKSVKTGTVAVRFVPDTAMMSQLGIGIEEIAGELRILASGFELEKVKLENSNEETKVLFTYPQKAKVNEIYETVIPTRNGMVPLSQLGKLELVANPTTITRIEGKRTIGVNGSVKPGVNIAETNKRLEDYARSLELPAGYTWSTGGVNEENNKSVASIIQAMGLSALLILITLVLEFKSFRQALLSVLVIPISISGVFYAFGTTGTPLSFPALIGILALFGIVVTNAVVVIEKINTNRDENMSLKEAIVDAAGSRLEPVLLTSATTILGLLPITFSDPLWRGLGGAIISGLLFSGIIKLFFIPVIYYEWFKDETDSSSFANK